MTGQEIDQLIVQAVDHGTLIIPDTLRIPKGQPETMAMLATLVDATTPTLTRDVRNTYVVRSGDSLALIAVKYYGSTDAVNDIFWPNKGRLSDPDQLRVGQTIFLPRCNQRPQSAPCISFNRLAVRSNSKTPSPSRYNISGRAAAEQISLMFASYSVSINVTNRFASLKLLRPS